MGRSWLKAMSWMKQTPGKKLGALRSKRRRERAPAAVEALDPRVMLAVTASFASAAGELKVIGDDQDNVIVISRTVGGTILVNNGVVPILGGTPTVANTNHLHLVG